MVQAPDSAPQISDTQLTAQVQSSVVAEDPWRRTSRSSSSLLWFVASYADGMIPWGAQVHARDAQLRKFLTTESFVTSALATAVARNTALNWALDGTPDAVEERMAVLNASERGQGFEDLIAAVSWDLYTTDNGGFIELVGKDRPDSPCFGLQHLDSLRCHLTGAPDTPVIYQDLFGRWHELRWWQVWHLTEVPTPIERLSGMQICALSRILAGAQTWRSLQQMVGEKASGMFTKAVHVINADVDAIKQAIDESRDAAMSQGQQRYMQPVVVESMDPKNAVSVATIDLASIPEGFQWDEQFKQIVTLIAMGLLEDYQTFAPLPGGGLGTSAQSNILHMKARGKGPGLFMKRWATMMNTRGILPKDVVFRWDEQDIELDQAKANVRLTRAQVRSQMVTTGELDAVGAQAVAVDDGDLTPEISDEVAKRAEEQKAEQARMQAEAVPPTTPGAPPGARGASAGDVVSGSEAGQAQKSAPTPEELRTRVEQAGTDAMSGVLRRMEREAKATLAQEETSVKMVLRDDEGRISEVVEEKGSVRIRRIIERDERGALLQIREVSEVAS